MMNKTLTVIIPVSRREPLDTIQNSINVFKRVDFTGFDAKIVYAIDVPEDMRPYYQNLKINENMELLWVHDTQLKQTGAYNAGLDKYPSSDYYAFFDVDAIPAKNFFQSCTQVDADFVSCDRLVSNATHNSMTETIDEEYKFCNYGRQLMYKHTKKFFPASCTGLIRRCALNYFRFTEKTSADSELYRHILCNNFTMGYAFGTYYAEDAPTTTKELYSQRLRWLSDTFRTCKRTVGSGNTWKINISNMLMYFVGIFPLIGIIAMLPYAVHIRRYNFVSHSIFMQFVSFVALVKTLKGDDVEWI